MKRFFQQLSEEAHQWRWIDDNVPDLLSEGPQPTHIGYMLLILWGRLSNWIMRAFCLLLEHDIEIDDNPEAIGDGYYLRCTGWHCTRCGTGGVVNHY